MAQSGQIQGSSSSSGDLYQEKYDIGVGSADNPEARIHIQLHDLNAKLISEGELELVNNKQIRKVIDVSSLQKGIYVVTLALNNKIHSIKFNKL